MACKLNSNSSTINGGGGGGNGPLKCIGIYVFFKTSKMSSKTTDEHLTCYPPKKTEEEKNKTKNKNI